MARDMTPVLKRCRSLGLEPTFLGIVKSPIEMLEKEESQASILYSLKKSRKQSSFMECLRSLSVIIMRKLRS